MSLGLDDDWEDIDPSERRQRLLKADGPHDAEPVTITHRQATLIMNLVAAAADGHELSEALRDIKSFLLLKSVEAIGGNGHIRVRGTSTSEQAWQRVEQWPLPPPGSPRPQQV